MGTYRKVHLVVALDRGTMEGGATPGDALPVFDCDFGKLGPRSFPRRLCPLLALAAP